MDIISDKIHKKSIKATALHFDISEEDASRIMHAYSKYIFYNINQTDLSKDLAKQNTRFLIPGAGVVYLNKVFLLTNDIEEGRIDKDTQSLLMTWFKGGFKKHRKLINIYKRIKNNIDND